MKKAEIEKLAKSLSQDQRYAIHRALDAGADRAVKLGRKLKLAECEIPRGYRSSIAASTRRSLVRKGLSTGTDYSARLTPVGRRVAEVMLEQDPVTIEAEDGSAILFKSSDAMEIARYWHERRQREEQEHKDKTKRAARLWRGLELDDSLYGTSSKAVSTAIKREFANNNWRDKLALDLDDLICIGEGIEELRDRGKRALASIEGYFRTHPHPDGTDGHEELVVVRSLLDGTAHDGD